MLVLSFISVLLFQRSGHFCLFLPFCVCECVFPFFCFYFADAFSSTMWSDLRAAVPQGSSVLQSLASSLPVVALATEHPVIPPSIFLLTKDGGLGHENMA